jgi:hypothetical protein
MKNMSNLTEKENKHWNLNTKIVKPTLQYSKKETALLMSNDCIVPKVKGITK